MERGIITKERRRAYKKKYRGRTHYRGWLAMLMIVSMLVTMTSGIAWGDVPAVIDEGSVCHAGHEDCTWVEAVEGHACGYIVDEDEVEEEILNCRHEHDSSSYPAGLATPYDASMPDCHHQHDEGCYAIETASPSDAGGQAGSHIHDEDCGYVKEVEGVRCNHDCEICDELYGELPKTALYKNARNADTKTGDFNVSFGPLGNKSDKIELTFEDDILTISGKTLKEDESGSVTIGMKEGVEETAQCIVIEVPARGGNSDMVVFLDGINIETDGSAPITVSGDGGVCVDLMEGTENNLTINGSSSHAALEIGPDVDLDIGGAVFNSTGALSATATRGAAIGGAYGKDTGSIRISTGTIYAKSEEDTGIGGGYGGDAKSITIGKRGWSQSGRPLSVNVDAGRTGIGGGYGGDIGDIVIQGGAIINVTHAGYTGIGGGYANPNQKTKVSKIEILEDSNVTVESGYMGIGAGYSGEVGDITIKNSAVDVMITGDQTAIGSGFQGKHGNITIYDSTVTARQNEESLGNGGYGIGNKNAGVSGAIEVSFSTVELNGFQCGMSAKLDPAYGIANGISLEHSDVTIGLADNGFSGTALYSTSASGQSGTAIGDIRVLASYLHITGNKYQTGIMLSGTDGNIRLEEGSDVSLEIGDGISTDGTLHVGGNKLLIEFADDTSYGKDAISGKGSVIFYDGSVTEINQYGYAIDLDGTAPASFVDFQEGSQVLVRNTNNSYGDKVIKCGSSGSSGSIHVAPGAELAAVSLAIKSDMLETGSLTGSPICVLNSGSDLKGRVIEIRDKDGHRLNPEVAYTQAETYRSIALPLPAADDYILYVDGKPQSVEDYYGEEKTVFSIKEGINKPLNMEGEGEIPGPAVTGITLGSTKETVRAGSEITLDVQIQPADAANKSVTVSSNDPVVAVARVDEKGVVRVRGYQAGTATITVKTVDGGYSAACEVKVLGEGEEVEDEYGLTVEGSYASASGAGRYAPGTVVGIHAGTRSGYRFAEWRAVSTEKVTFADSSAPDTTFVMPTAKVTVNAYWVKETNGAATGGSSGNSGGSSSNATQTWNQNTDGTWSCQNGGIPYQSEWAYIYNPYADVSKGQSPYGWFRFDADGNMQTGWYTDENGNTYYLWPYADNAQGTMAVGWQWIRGEDGKERCYYFNPNPDGTQGRLLTNLVIEDKYLVDDKGAWMEDGVVVTR